MPDKPWQRRIGSWLVVWACVGGGLALAASPDLVVSDIWEANGRIYYQLRNAGDAVAPSGHLTTLVVDGKAAATDQVPVELQPGARLVRSFPEYLWRCTPPADIVAVRADSLGQVAEASETNNVREENWNCENP